MNNPALAIWVPGLPAPQGSKKVVPTARGHRVIEGNEARLRPWRQAVAIEASLAMGRDASPTRGAVRVELAFSFPRPAGHYGNGRNQGIVRDSAPAYKTTKPDLDKLARSVLDALTGIVFVDDAQVDELLARKRFGAAGVDIVVEFAGATSWGHLTASRDGVESLTL